MQGIWRWTARAPAIAATSIAIVGAGTPQLPALPADVPATARLYTPSTADRPEAMAAWTDPDGTVQIVYQRRGPGDCLTNIRSVITLDAAGVPIRLQHTGQICAPSRTVHESYYRAGSAGRWQNAVGQGEGDTAGKKFYASLTRLPEERALLVRAGIAFGGRVPLLPEGEAQIERVAERVVRAGDRMERVTCYRVTGLDPTPTHVWLDSRGELFAFDGLILQGWNHVADELRKAVRRP
jgi:hypothetical protein